jgi:hypothetical protein
MSATIFDPAQIIFSFSQAASLIFKCPAYSLFKLLENTGVAWWELFTQTASAVNSTKVYKN